MNLGMSEGFRRVGCALAVGASIKKELKASVSISSEVAKAVFRLSENLKCKVFSILLILLTLSSE